MAAETEKNSPSEGRQEIAEMLSRLDEQIQTLRVEFEQYFTGVLKFQPEKLKAEVERGFRKLLKAPLKNSELNFRARSLKYKFNSLDTYWRRVLREKEEGRYHKDVFKATFRKNQNKLLEKSKSKEGIALNQMQSIYEVYVRSLAQSGFTDSKVSFETFKGALSQRASAIRNSNPGKKIKFSVVLKDGMPTVEASVKE
jgi:hypothetical protein